MKLEKHVTLKGVDKGFVGNYSIYKAETVQELQKTGGHAYILVPTIDPCFLTNEISTLVAISEALEEGQGVFGIGTFDTIRECELYYELSCARNFVQTMYLKYSDFSGMLTDKEQEFLERFVMGYD